MDTRKPIVIASFTEGQTGSHSGETVLPLSAQSFVAFKVSVGDLSSLDSPNMSVKVSITASSELGNVLGYVGLYEMTDANWVATDSYDKVQKKVIPSPLAIVHVDNTALDIDGTNPKETEFELPSTVVDRWRTTCQGQVALALAPYGEFEYEGTMGISSSDSVEIEFTEGSSGTEEPFDINVIPTTLVANARGKVTIVTEGATFKRVLQDNHVNINGTDATIVSGNETSLTFIVPNNVDGKVELVILNNNGVASSNPVTVFVDSGKNNKNRYFNKRVTNDGKHSHSAVYNRDLGFNNFAEVTDENSIVQNIYNCLLTRKGERLFNPHFGTTIESRIFSIMNEQDEISILQECFAAIEDYEPRVAIDYDQSRIEIEQDGNSARVIIAVVLPEGSSEFIVLPFKNRGILI